MTKQFKIQLQPAGTRCKVFIDGQEVTNCRALKIEAAVDKATVVTVEYVNVEVAIEGEANLVETTTISNSHRTYGRSRALRRELVEASDRRDWDECNRIEQQLNNEENGA